MDWRIGGQPVFQPERALQIVNWIRLGLLTVAYDTSLTEEDRYAWVDENRRVMELRASFDTDEFKRVEVTRGLMGVTAFGRAFHEAVMQPTAVPSQPPEG